MGVLDQNGRMIDTGCIADTFVSGLGEVEDLGGGCFRFVFYVRQTVAGHEERLVVAKLVAPMEMVPPAIRMAVHAVGLSLANDAPRWLKLH